MAASKDLLEALELMCKEHEFYIGAVGRSYNKAKVAINKAKGIK